MSSLEVAVSGARSGLARWMRLLVWKTRNLSPGAGATKARAKMYLALKYL